MSSMENGMMHLCCVLALSCACASTAPKHVAAEASIPPCGSGPPSYTLLEVGSDIPQYEVRLLLSGFPTITCSSCLLEVMVGEQLGEAGVESGCGGSVYLRRRPSPGEKVLWRQFSSDPWKDTGIVIKASATVKDS